MKCLKCNIPLDNPRYNTKYCKDCRKIVDKIQKKESKLRNKTKISDYGKKRYNKYKDKFKTYSLNYGINNREIINKKAREHYHLNKDKMGKFLKLYRTNNKDKIKIRNQAYRNKNREKLKQMNKENYLQNKYTYYIKSKEYRSRPEVKARIKSQSKLPHIKAYKKLSNRNYRLKNKEVIKITNQKYRKENKLKLNAYFKYRFHFDENYRIKFLIKNRFKFILRKYILTGNILDSDKYNLDYKAIIEHLKPFPKDISKYHIDHIRPLCSFIFIKKDGTTDLEEVKEAFSPKNHQWLLAEDNLSKGGKYENSISL